MNQKKGKNSMHAFVSNLSRHTPTSLGHDLGAKEFLKTSKSAASSPFDKFTATNKFFDNVGTVTRALNLLNQFHAGVIKNGDESGTNSTNEMVPFTSQAEVAPLGKNDAKYYKVHTHIGKPTSSRIRKLKSGPHIETVSRLTASSSRDYLDHKRRDQLNFKAGFNEKTFSFLLEDTYFSIGDYYRLLRIRKNHEKELKEIHESKKDIYGCVLGTKHKFKLKNRMDFYTLHLKIHLIKILDPKMDVRQLVETITHNPFAKSLSTANKIGKIPADLQYSNPNLLEVNNKLSLDFQTALNCNLTQSSKFMENARIVKSWTRSLPPGSIWDFNLNHHLGKGIHINKIYDLENSSQKHKDPNFVNIILDEIQNKGNQTKIKTLKEGISKLLEEKDKEEYKISEHPTGFIFCFEFVGDRRASIMNLKKDYFSGYSPCHFNMEFDTEIKFLEEQGKMEDILVYKRTSAEKNFHEESEFPDIFYPDRSAPFHVPFEEIGKKFKLEYDSVIKSSSDYSNILGFFAEKLEEFGINLDNISPDDLKFNYTKDPSYYEGTGGPPPATEENDEDP